LTGQGNLKLVASFLLGQISIDSKVICPAFWTAPEKLFQGGVLVDFDPDISLPKCIPRQWAFVIISPRFHFFSQLGMSRIQSKRLQKIIPKVTGHGNAFIDCADKHMMFNMFAK
jgi:hypothetical protein